MSWDDFKEVFINSTRMYFAPLTGAYKGIRDELKRYHAPPLRD